MRPVHVSCPTPLIDANGALAPSAVAVLSLISGLPEQMLGRARIRPASANWLRAPWYGYQRGGALTIGRTIWFTSRWWHDPGLGDRSQESTWRWLLHLAHEVGHLAQAGRCGHSLPGRAQYVMRFVLQYAWRALTFRRDVHDGAPWEIEADIGRWVLAQLVAGATERAALLHILCTDTPAATASWCRAHAQQAIALRARYRASVEGRSKLAPGSP